MEWRFWINLEYLACVISSVNSNSVDKLRKRTNGKYLFSTAKIDIVESIKDSLSGKPGLNWSDRTRARFLKILPLYFRKIVSYKDEKAFKGGNWV